jgi:hypothetical protein
VPSVGSRGDSYDSENGHGWRFVSV